MTILSDGNAKPVREDPAQPTPVGGKPSPRLTMMPKIVNLEEESDFGPFLGEVEPPAQVAKFVPRKPLEPIRVSVIADAQAQPAVAPLSIRTPLLPLVRSLATWRNIALGGLALLVVGQTAYMALWMGAGESLPPTTGSVTVTSTPSGSPVTIDGAASGQTPLTISLAAGSHRIEIGSGGQLNSQYLNVAGGGNASLHVELAQASAPAGAAESPKAADDPPAARASNVSEPRVSEPRAAAPAALPTGWLAVSSGIPMQILDKGNLVGSSEVPRIVLPAGTHELELVNAGLDYRVFRTVEITAGQTTSVGLKPPMGTLAVNALPWAEVWIDGQRAGETPIGNLSIEIGNHEILFRHPELGEQRRIVTVGALGPARVGVDMKKP